ncbi:putative Replication protein A 30 kDa subunit [Zostera marina]|uniref:Putative Replication protein A 30 kDa subunit n=1 Tax=Zostera marina TaxID=29655 RepID=A0A0K9P5Y7_ZOSMR|nr:putative Replication protein A 30 kDa subunit [Zostera marina]
MQQDGNALFSGGGFMPSQTTQITEYGGSSSTKSRSSQGVFPVTVKQISECLHSGDGKSITLGGTEVSNVRLLGLVMNKIEKITDVSFTLDDGTGRIGIQRWVHEQSDTNEMVLVRSGTYVKVNGHLKDFQGKLTVMAFSVRPLTDFDDLTLHYIECIHVHISITGKPVNPSTAISSQIPVSSSQFLSAPNMASKNYVAPSNYMTSNKANSTDLSIQVANIFDDPVNLSREHGLHLEEVSNQLRVPLQRIRDVVEHLISEGHIYSTIDDNHYKSAANG